MTEFRRERVQTVSGLVFYREAAVKAVVDDVHAGEGELCADLVRDAGEDRHLEKRAFLVFDGDMSNWIELGDGMQGFETRDLG